MAVHRVTLVTRKVLIHFLLLCFKVFGFPPSLRRWSLFFPFPHPVKDLLQRRSSFHQLEVKEIVEIISASLRDKENVTGARPYSSGKVSSVFWPNHSIKDRIQATQVFVYNIQVTKP